jgi:hypothetical protein
MPGTTEASDSDSNCASDQEDGNEQIIETKEVKVVVVVVLGTSLPRKTARTENIRLVAVATQSLFPLLPTVA